MPSNVQIYRQVLLSNTKISKKTKNAFHKQLQKYNAIILKSSNDIGHTDCIERHKATRPDAVSDHTLWLSNIMSF